MHLEDPQVRTSEAAELVRQAPLGEATLAEEPRPEQFAPPPGVKTGAPTWRSAVGLPADWRLALIIGAVVAVAIWLRFATASAEWLDEALTVNIAAAPISDLPRLLHRDGAPPLYYAALHYWIVAFGQSNLATRSLSGVFGVINLPVAWLAGYRIGSRWWSLPQAPPEEVGPRVATGRIVGWASLLLVASSPFAVYYDTEARMYGLVLLLSTLGILALTSLLRRPSALRAILLAADASALLYSHYWSLYLGAVVGLGIAWCAWRGPHRRACRYALAAMILAGLSFLPWLPTFLFQLHHTGTPWASPAAMTAIVFAVTQFAGGNSDPGRALALIFFFLAILALGGSALSRRQVVLDLRTRPGVRSLALCVLGTLFVALVAGRLSGSTFADRYTSVIAVPALVVVAYGLSALSDPRVRNGFLAAAVALGLAAAVPNAFLSRTQAGEVAAAIATRASSGDLVAYCPDQLGPGVYHALGLLGSGNGGSRLGAASGYDAHPAARGTLRDRLREITFPRQTSPRYVDWVDYQTTVEQARVGPFVHRLLSTAGPARTIFYVWAPGYLGYANKCQAIADALSRTRTMATVVGAQASDTPFEIFEGETLDSFAPR